MKLSDALRSSLANTFAAAGFNFVGDLTGPDRLNWADGSLGKVGLHAVMGGLAAEAAGGDFRTGALAAGLNEALVDSLAKQYGEMPQDKKDSLLVMNSQLIGLLAAATQSNADAESVQTGAWVAGNATQYNYLLHSEIAEREKELQAAKTEAERDQILQRYASLDKARNAEIDSLCTTQPSACMEILTVLRSERHDNDELMEALRKSGTINSSMGVLLASESNEAAISAIQNSLIRQEYGDSAAVLGTTLELLAAGGVPVGKGGAKEVDRWSRTPKSLQDQMALKAAQEGQGTVIIKNLNDPKYKGMEKVELKVKSANGGDSVVHYVRDQKTGELMDFKFKKHSTD